MGVLISHSFAHKAVPGSALKSMANTSLLCAVVVTYHPELERLKQVLEAGLPQVAALVVVDNGSDEQCLSLVRSWSRSGQFGAFSLIELGQNLGVAAAQNRGIAWAREQGGSHILLLDQDSIPAQDMTRFLLQASMKLSRQCRLAAVGPVFKDAANGRVAPFIRINHGESTLYDKPEFAGCVPADVLISSGTLISLAVIDRVGAMDESLFIDAVDTEWCLRACSEEYQSFGVMHAVLYHSLGDKTHTVWFGRRRHLPEHTPLRFYYIFRNSLLLYKRGYIPLRWKMKNLITLAGLLLFGTALMPERFRRIKMVLLGISDGLCGKAGKCEAA